MLSGAWPAGAPNVLLLVLVVMTGTWGVARYTVQLIFTAVVLLIVVDMYGLCEFYVLKRFSRDIVRHT